MYVFIALIAGLAAGGGVGYLIAQSLAASKAQKAKNTLEEAQAKAEQIGIAAETKDLEVMVKAKVKAMILGDQNMAALAEEIAQELAAEMNIPLSQAPTNTRLGISTLTRLATLTRTDTRIPIPTPTARIAPLVRSAN